MAKCEAKNETPAIEAVLEAFLTPALKVVLNSGDKPNGMASRRSINCARFMRRCRVEPDSIREIAEQEFEGSQKAFLDAFGRSLPDFSCTELRWKLDLVIAVLLRVLTEAGKPNALIQGNLPENIKATVSKLVSFLASGLRS